MTTWSGKSIGNTPIWPTYWTVPEPVADEKMPDIEVGRYALRTFRIFQAKKGLGLRSLFFSTEWVGGTMIAECQHEHKKILSAEDFVAHKAPHPQCTCGIYGALTLDQLALEYYPLSARIVAVIAAEGTTYIGTKGLRTEAARVVAYWHHDDDEDAQQACSVSCPDAIRFSDVHDMVKNYDLSDSALEFTTQEPMKLTLTVGSEIKTVTVGERYVIRLPRLFDYQKPSAAK